VKNLAVPLVLILAMLIVWGVGMYCVTSVTAEYAAERYLDDYGDFAAHISRDSFERLNVTSTESPNFGAALEDVADTRGQFIFLHNDAEGEPGFLGRNENDTFSYVLAVFDASGTMLANNQVTSLPPASSGLPASFTYNGKEYGGVDELIRELGSELSGSTGNLARYEGLDLIIPSVTYCLNIDGETHYTDHYYGEKAYAETPPQVQFFTVAAVHCSPWRTAFSELRGVYTVTFLLTAALAFGVYVVIRRQE